MRWLRRVWEDFKWAHTKSGKKLPLWSMAVCPTLHYCSDWDGMVIDKGDAEFQCCTCRTVREPLARFWTVLTYRLGIWELCPICEDAGRIPYGPLWRKCPRCRGRGWVWRWR